MSPRSTVAGGRACSRRSTKCPRLTVWRPLPGGGGGFLRRLPTLVEAGHRWASSRRPNEDDDPPVQGVVENLRIRRCRSLFTLAVEYMPRPETPIRTTAIARARATDAESGAAPPVERRRARNGRHFERTSRSTGTNNAMAMRRPLPAAPASRWPLTDLEISSRHCILRSAPNPRRIQKDHSSVSTMTAAKATTLELAHAWPAQ